MSAIAFKKGKTFLLVPQFQGEKPLPSLPRMAANLARAQARSAVSQLRGNPRHVSEETRDARRALCRENVCGFYRQDVDRCANPKCGCPVSHRGLVESKTELYSEFCPATPRRWTAGEMVIR